MSKIIINFSLSYRFRKACDIKEYTKSVIDLNNKG